MKFQTKLSDEKTKCLICPRNCVLKEGQRGFCHTRKNIKGEIKLTTYGYNTGLSIDPVEKKPLYHFYPASKVLSFGTVGCPMGCLFCQNSHISKNRENPENFNKTNPEKIVSVAKKYGVKSVAFTYNDPIAFFEYALDCAKLLQKEEIKTIAVTSGFFNLEAAKEFFKFMDATNVDLKGFSEKFYKKNCGAKLAPVLEVINYIKNETNCHLELTTMLIEGENDGCDELKGEIDWVLGHLGEDVPLHFSAFFPKYKFKNRAQTNFETLYRAREIALESGLNYVYTGNLASIETSTTYCRKCGKPIILREGYKISKYNMKDNRCLFCGEKQAGYFN